MRNLSLGKQIGAGFFIMLLIILVMGVTSLKSVMDAVENSEELNNQFLKEIEIANNVERNFSKVRISMSKYIFAKKSKYKTASDGYFEKVHKYLDEATVHANKYPELTDLVSRIEPLKVNMKIYQDTTDMVSQTFRRS